MLAHRVHNRIHLIPIPFAGGGTVFSYLVKGERVAVIDTGVSDSPLKVLQPALAEVGLRLADISFILNTHAHLDHVGGNAGVKSPSRGLIHVHSADAAMARSLEAEIAFHTEPLRALDFPPGVIANRGEEVRRGVGTAAGVDVLISDGNTVNLGDGVRLRVVHCPGHTPGSVAYWWDEEGIAFTGDSVQGLGSRPGGYPLYHDAPSYRRTLERLLRRGCRALFLGHAYLGGTLINHPIRRGAQAEAFIRASIESADTIHSAVRRAALRFPKVSVCGTLPPYSLYSGVPPIGK